MAIQVVVIRVGEPPEVRDIETSLEVSQAIVGGYIQCVPLSVVANGRTYYVDLICNEEGLLYGLPYNLSLTQDAEPCSHECVDEAFHLFGDVFFAEHTDDGEMASLTPAVQNELLQRLSR